MQVQPLNIQEMAEHKATHRVIVTYADFTAAATTQTLTPVTVAAKFGVKLVKAFLKTAFSGGAATSLTISSGDGGSATRFLAATEFHSTGTEVFNIGGVNPNPEYYQYTAADTVDLFVTSVTANVNTLTAGEVHFLFDLANATTVN